MAHIGGVNYEGKYFIVHVPEGWTAHLPWPDPSPKDLWFDRIDEFNAALAGPRRYRPLKRPFPPGLQHAPPLASADGVSAPGQSAALSISPILTGFPSTWSTMRRRRPADAQGKPAARNAAPVVFVTVSLASFECMRSGRAGGSPQGDQGTIRLTAGVTFEGRYFITPLPVSWQESDPLPAAGPEDVWFDRQNTFVAAFKGPWNRSRIRREAFRAPVPAIVWQPRLVAS